LKTNERDDTHAGETQKQHTRAVDANQRSTGLTTMMARASMWRVLTGLLLTTATVRASTSAAAVIRRLQDDDAAYFEYDLSAFSLRFEKCQFVKMYDDDLAQDEDSTTPLALKHFVVFRLCPSDSCDKCEVYGTYTLDVENYLEMTIENQAQDFEDMCENCNEQCNGDGDYCSGCGKTCYLYDNLEASGYVDASQYIQCQQLDLQNDDDGNNNAADDDGAAIALYIGPRCNSGNSITIGLFSDENCFEPIEDGSMDIEEILGAKLSYHLLRHTYSSTDSVCLSCAEGVYEADDDQDAADEDNVNEMCENIYKASAKCETETGLTNGFIQTNREDEDYENQVENEFMACTFIKSLIWNSYTETGEINFQDTQDVIVRQMTQNQKISVGLLGGVFAGLLGLLLYFHLKIKEASQPDLVSPGGSLA